MLKGACPEDMIEITAEFLSQIESLMTMYVNQVKCSFEGAPTAHKTNRNETEDKRGTNVKRMMR